MNYFKILNLYVAVLLGNRKSPPLSAFGECHHIWLEVFSKPQIAPESKGVGRRENAAYMGICEYFGAVYNAVIGC